MNTYGDCCTTTVQLVIRFLRFIFIFRFLLIHTINLFFFFLFHHWLNIECSPVYIVAATTAIAARCADIFPSSPFSLLLFSFYKLISIYIHERDFNICSNKSCCSSLLFGEAPKHDETHKQTKAKRREKKKTNG